jgi:hypothetical protein
MAVNLTRLAPCRHWTTTPWTLPGNHAIFFAKDCYGSAVAEARRQLAKSGDYDADNSRRGVQTARVRIEKVGLPTENSTACGIPSGKGYDFTVRCLPANA